MRFPSQQGFGSLILIVAFFVLVTAYPEGLLFPFAMTYILLGPLAEASRWMRRHFKWFPGTGRS